MIYLAYFIIVFISLQFIISLLNLLFKPTLSAKKVVNEQLVSVLIPARNEEKNIANLIQDLLEQEYTNIEIIVFDDNSTDDTDKIVRCYALNDSRIKIVNSKELPSGWLGKNYACHSLSLLANGSYFLFLDADVRIGKDVISRCITICQKRKYKLLSVFPEQIMVTKGEWATVPLMNYVLLSLLPLFLVKWSRFVSLSAANGQFMFFDALKYREYMPHERMKNRIVEDLAIARFYKSKRSKIVCYMGDESIKCRMYWDFDGAFIGFSKNINGFFGNSFILSFLFWLITTFGFIIVFIHFSTTIFLLFLLLIILTRVNIAISSNQSVIKNILFIIPQQFNLGLLIFKAFYNKIRKKHEWKGRIIN